MTTRRTITAHEVFRRQAGLSVTDCARIMGVSHAYVSRIEGRQIPASEAYQDRAAKALNLDSWEDLFWDDMAMEFLTEEDFRAYRDATVEERRAVAAFLEIA